MELGEFGYPLVDLGVAPEIFCSGLGTVEPLGANARFTFFSAQRDRFGAPERLVNVRLVVPIDAVGPGIELTVITLGSGLIVPVSRFIASRLFH